MIGRKTLIELAHIAAGIVLALVMAWGMAWAVPLAKIDIWAVDIVSIVIILIMGVQPVREAMAADKAAGGSARANG
ncbi:MAG: hypothetical protein K2Y20_08355 [Sphingomonas sp.]|nr:hypothetical protein [Sphingomonas sp.]